MSSPFADLLARVPVSSHQSVIAGVNTVWFDYGDPSRDVDIVMIHGFRGDHHGLEPFVAELGPHVRILIPDLPGFGDSGAFIGEGSIEAYADWLISFVTALAPSAAVLGHSFGSIVVACARSRGLRPLRTILVNPIADNALRGPRGAMTALAVGYYRASAALPERWGRALLRNRAIVRVMSATMAKTKDRALRRWIHGQHDSYFSLFASRRAVLDAFRASVSHDVREYADALTGPLLLVVADRDDITPLARQIDLAALLPQSQLAVIADVGHLVHYEAAAQASNHIRQFLSLPGLFP